ncbi:two-component sensor histidine kinase [Rhizocola hellebori]|uniref:Two-component sensor histidine kinase n=1 Tax=Rhizocola hellebori TaxID=1392758 RepID=A0A8J3QJH6_9ACTN|nr:sensor histidine kinase [Rhizocola hellebori]GIH10864.1 two-component sensor histidine kinase [Rhizocola hellebori]
MSDDVSLAGQASELTAWERSLPWWDVYYAVVLAGTILFSFQPVSTAILGVMALWYVVFGRYALNCSRKAWHPWLYLIVAWLLLIPAVSFSGGAAFILFALAAQAHIALDFRHAVVVSTVTNLTPTTVHFLRDGQFMMDLTIGLMGVVLSAITGLTIDRLVQQGRALAESRAEVARLSALAERQRLAGDLHDTIAQGLSSVVMLVQAADAALDRDREQARRHLELAARTARENLQELRSVLEALMPTGHHLEEALHRLGVRFAEETGVSATVEVHGTVRTLPAATEVVLLRAAQESLSNVRQHAKATRVWVELTFDDQNVHLQVRDDGLGFEPETTTGGHGLAAMRSRVTQAGGDVAVQPTAQGTTVLVAVPA